MLWITTNIRLILISLAASALFLSGWFINGWRWSNKYDSLVIQYKQEQIKAEKEARAKELELQAAIDSERTIKDEQVRHIRMQLDSTLDQLRQRSLRNSKPLSASDSKGATGSELYREDAEFLIREAARADEIRAGLKECYASYDHVRNTFTLNKR